MSYDLFFRSRPGARALDREQFQEYFAGRAHYRLEGEQAWYGNEDTGVYFSFELAARQGAADVSDEEDADSVPEDASFNLNYYRPHVFGLEAEPEVAAFVEAFRPVIEDPQMGGMGDDEYSRDGFLAGWNQGNEFAYRSIAGRGTGDARPSALPTAEIERCWVWNRDRRALQLRAGESAFVPKIMFLEIARQVKSFVVWGDGMPIFLPRVECVVVARRGLAPRKWLRQPKDMALVAWADLPALLEEYELRPGPVPYRAVEYASLPPAVSAWVRSLSPSEKTWTGVTVDKILNAELLERTGGAS